jgi:predicted amidophosphoribosyltransferase
MLDSVIMRFSPGVKYILVPLPTIQKHIRSRGFDHIARLCRDFSSISGFSVCPALMRIKNTVQVGSSKEKRLEQAYGAYMINPRVNLSPESHYLLVDDVWTTGATMRAARDVLAAELKQLGAIDIKISAIVLAKNSGYNFD